MFSLYLTKQSCRKQQRGNPVIFLIMEKIENSPQTKSRYLKSGQTSLKHSCNIAFRTDLHRKNTQLKAIILIVLKRKIAVLLAIFPYFLLGGCASLKEVKEEFEGYQADTAILIGDVPYLINTVKCAQIKAIGENGALDCYDSEGRQSASITPFATWRRNFVKEKLGMEWASPKHQEYLFHMIHGGGNQKVMGGFVSSAHQVSENYTAAKNLNDSINKSKEISLQDAQMKMKGTAAYMSGGMPAWQAHQSNVMQWRQDNSRYFLNQMNKSNPIESN